MSFDFSNLRNLAYDVRVRPEGLLVLNTTLAENDLFYGKVYASGSATISGNKNGVNMNIVASTAGNSQFFLPLSGASNISAADFIVFEDPVSKQRTDSLHRMSRRKQILLNRKTRLRNTAPRV
ncbi:MAG: translocation/assembly module TamB domain-containing protein [Alistipes indistinctus]